MMRVYFHGNCQARAMQRMLVEVGDELVIGGREVQAVKIPYDMDAYCADITSADVIICQPVADSYKDEPRLSTTWVRDNKKAGARLVVFPSLYFGAYTPQVVYLRPLQAVGMPYHDTHYVAGYVAGRSAADVLTEMDDPGYLPLELVTCGVETALAALRNREALSCDVTASDLIENEYRRQLLFHTPNHPARFLLRSVLDRLLAATGLDVRATPDGRDYLRDLTIPPHPSVSRALGLEATPDFADLDGFSKFRLPKREPVARADYLAELWEHYDKIGGREVMDARLQEERNATSYLKRLAQMRGA